MTIASGRRACRPRDDADASVETSWMRTGARRYPNAQVLFITADAGDSNGYRSRGRKAELQWFADEIGISSRVSPFPASTLPTGASRDRGEPRAVQIALRL